MQIIMMLLFHSQCYHCHGYEDNSILINLLTFIYSHSRIVSILALYRALHRNYNNKKLNNSITAITNSYF